MALTYSLPTQASIPSLGQVEQEPIFPWQPREQYGSLCGSLMGQKQLMENTTDRGRSPLQHLPIQVSAFSRDAVLHRGEVTGYSKENGILPDQGQGRKRRNLPIS